jgi:serine/threonine-protein kinase
VRKAGDRIRITIQLINVADGYHLWSETYDRRFTDVFALQDEIAGAVVAALKVSLLGASSLPSNASTTRKVDAYNAMLQGDFFVRGASIAAFRKAIPYYEQAIRLDPGFALAYARLSITLSLFPGDLDQSVEEVFDAMRRARSTAETAIRLAPDLSDAHAALGWAYLNDGEPRGSEAEFRRAIALAPNQAGHRMWLSIVLASVSRDDEALAMIDAELAIDPLSAYAHGTRGYVLIRLERNDEAEAALRKSLELQPSSSYNHAWLAYIEAVRGHFDAAMREARLEPDESWRLFGIELTQYASGDRTAANATMAEYIEKYARINQTLIADLYGLRGDKEQALAWLGRAYDENDAGVLGIESDPLLRALRDDPRFRALARKIQQRGDAKT